jgi:hypothetical protein
MIHYTDGIAGHLGQAIIEDGQQSQVRYSDPTSDPIRFTPFSLLPPVHSFRTEKSAEWSEPPRALEAFPS